MGKESYLLKENIFAAFLTNLTSFVDLVYRCGLAKRTLHLDFFNEIFLLCRVSNVRGQK